MVGSYRVERCIGQGGMGRVYEGLHPHIGSRVAIKVLTRDVAANPQVVRRFFEEARSVNVIRHENIVNVLDLATLPDGRPFILMELLDGESLAHRIATRGALPAREVVRIATQVLDALGAAHQQGVVHRDIKPDNIFVT
ncbi:MAG: serine/threonine protein kinase, partial [Deltaproteobacteria bacterium]